MNLEEYSQKAQQFAIYDDFKYVEYGIVNEISEVLEVYAKAYRGDYKIGDETFKLRLLKEVGDVCWTANEHVRLSDIVLSSSRITDERDIIEDIVDMLSYDFRAGQVVCELIEDMRDLLELYGFCLEDALEQNIEKLSGRQEAGTLKGDGDNR